MSQSLNKRKHQHQIQKQKIKVSDYKQQEYNEEQIKIKNEMLRITVF